MSETQNAKAIREHRDRRRRGVAVVPVEIEPATLTAALQSRGIIQPHEQPGKAELSTHLSAVVALWCAEPISRE